MDLFDRFLKEKTYLCGVSSETLRYYRWVRQAFAEILAQPTKEGMLSVIQKLLARGVSPISVNTYLRGFRAYINWLHQEGFLKEVFKVQLLKAEQKVIQTLSVEQVSRILHYSPKGVNERRTHTFVCVGLDTGLRLQELLSLTKENVDFDNMVLKVRGKGNKFRLVPFSIECRKILYRYLLQANPKLYIFSTGTGTAVSKRNLGRDMHDLGEKLKITGVRFSPHSLRHTFACSYLRAGGDLYTLSRILGHASISVTQLYLRAIGIEQISEAHQKFSPLSAVR